jgi:hypothetical protein
MLPLILVDEFLCTPIVCQPQLTLSGVGVEKGTKAVISVNFSVYGERTFNDLRTNFVVEILCKEFFNTHGRLH